MINLTPFRTGSDYTIKELGIVIHQLRLNEISDLGEYNLILFWNIINISKEDVIEDKNILGQITDLDVILEMLSRKENREEKRIFKEFMKILFPLYEIKIDTQSISLIYNIGENQDPLIFEIKKEDFDILKKHLNIIIPLNNTFEENEFFTTGKEANRIKQKLLDGRKKRKKLRAEQKSQEDNVDIFGRYCLILSIGLSLDYDNLVKCTLFQLSTLHETFANKRLFDHYVRAKEIGAKDIEEVNDWVGKTAFRI